MFRLKLLASALRLNLPMFLAARISIDPMPIITLGLVGL